MIESSNIKGIYIDNRSKNYSLKKIENNLYKVIEDEFYILYIIASDQYLIAENIYWDPISGNSFYHINGMNYKSMFNIPFIYSYGEYQLIPDTNNISTDLKNFLTQIWNQKKTIEVAMEEELKMVYYSIYSKSKQNTKSVPNEENTINIINEMVSFSNNKTSRTQSECILNFNSQKENNIVVDNIIQLHKFCKNQDKTISSKAFNGLYNNYYCYLIGKDEKSTRSRIILNVEPKVVPDALNKLWPILQNNSLVHSIKAGGPLIAAKKLDSIVIYAKNKNGFNDLLSKIINANIPTVNLLPFMINEVAPGIGTADEPEMIDGLSISFGQKRVILALMAHYQSDTLQEMITLTSIYFEQAGISSIDPSKETGRLPNTKIQSKIKDILKYF